MLTLLIVESNPPALLDQGNAASTAFVRSLLSFAPDAQLRIVAPQSEPLDTSVFAGIDGVIFTGSSSHWSTDAPEATPLRHAMQSSFEVGVPVWGSCNGMQLATVVLGGTIAHSPNGMEIGLARNLELTEEGAVHPMMAGRKNGFAVPCIHRDVVTRIPTGAKVLASNEHCEVQALTYNRDGVDFWGTQYHPELSVTDIAEAIARSGLFQGQSDAASDLQLAESDEEAARRVGTTVDAQRHEHRARELLNWLDHVRTR